MNFVKWLRKNNRKVMTFVVIFIMISFVLGQGVRYLVDSFFNRANQTIATYENNKKFKSKDFMNAQSELQILRILQSDQLLIAQAGRGFAGPLLTYMLFPDSQFSAEIPEQLKQVVRQGQIKITQEELDDFFNQPPERAEVLWMLLKAEAYQAGCILPSESARQTLAYAIPQMSGNRFSAAALLTQIINSNNITEDQIVRIFADLLSVLSYTNQVIDNQSVTINQIKASLGRTQEKVNAEYVEIPAQWFIDEKVEISDDRINEQFNTYKNISSGTVTSDNLFGFGYKLPRRVMLEYLILSMDDVKQQITRPTMDEAEKYYTNNLHQFQREEPSDPNNSESEKITVTSPYPEVAATIRRQLENEKTTTLANQVFNEITTSLESGFESINFDDATTEEIQQAAGDYQSLGQIADKYKITIQSGKTGWLATEEFSKDDVLNSLSLQRGQKHLRLSDLAFAVTADKRYQRHSSVPSMRLWENIGPLNGGFYSKEKKQYIRIMAMVRIVDIKEAEIPESVELSYNTAGAQFEEVAFENVEFSLKEKIEEDLLLLDAMQKAKEHAEALVESIKSDGWDKAIKNYNDSITSSETNNETAQDRTIEVAKLNQQVRASQTEILTAQRLMRENPASVRYIQNRLNNNMLTNKLYELLTESVQTTETIQTLMPFEPSSAYLIIKNVTRVPATMNDYLDKKSQTSLQINSTESAGVVLVHLNPNNIKKRMAFEPRIEQNESEEEIIDQEQKEKDA